MLKKTFYISLLLFFASLLFWGVYNLSFKKPENITQSIQENTPDLLPDLPKLNSNAILAITDEAVISPTLTADSQNIKYYSKTNGRVYSTDFEGTTKQIIAGKDLIGLSDVFWSPDKTKVISKFNRPSGEVQFYLFDYATNIGQPLKSNLDEVAWHNIGSKIFYKYYDQKTKERSLNIADPDGTNWKKLADLSYRNIHIAPIPQSGAVSFWNQPDSLTETIFESIPALGGERKTLFQGKFGADYQWNNLGTLVLVSHVDTKSGNKMQLATINFSGGEYKNLDIPTLVSKCAWSKDGKTIYYALPGGISPSAIMPNDYNEGKINSIDTFWKINITTGEKTRLVEVEKIKEKFDATNLFLNVDESILFFQNRYDGKVYRINL